VDILRFFAKQRPADTDPSQGFNQSSVAPNPELIGYAAAELLDALMMGKFPQWHRISIDPIRVFCRQSSDVMAVSDWAVASAARFMREHALHDCRVSDVLEKVNMSRAADLPSYFRVVLITKQSRGQTFKTSGEFCSLLNPMWPTRRADAFRAPMKHPRRPGSGRGFALLDPGRFDPLWGGARRSFFEVSEFFEGLGSFPRCS
jgi:hypothetical protein